jgi:glutaredoxin/glutathione-dependent peroxiredoxin
MSINVGDRIPSGTLSHMTATGPAPISTDDVFKGKRVVLFAVPGAFTPTCSNKHLPGYLKQYDGFKAKGIDSIVCLSVNDTFVMAAWGAAHEVGDKILMLADGNADYAKALGLEADFSKFGMGLRSKRFSMIVDDGIVKELNVEAPGEFKVSSAESTACQLA